MIFAKDGFWMFIESLNHKHSLGSDSSFADCLVRTILQEMQSGSIGHSSIVLIKPEDELDREAGSMVVTTIPTDASDLEEAEEHYSVSNVALSDVYEIGIEKSLSDGYVIVCEDFFTSKLEESEYYGEDIENTQPMWEEYGVEPDLFVYINNDESSPFGYSRKFMYEQILSLSEQDPNKYIILEALDNAEKTCSALWSIFEQHFGSKN